MIPKISNRRKGSAFCNGCQYLEHKKKSLQRYANGWFLGDVPITECTKSFRNIMKQDKNGDWIRPFWCIEHYTW